MRVNAIGQCIEEELEKELFVMNMRVGRMV